MYYLQITRLYIIYGPLGKRIMSEQWKLAQSGTEFAESLHHFLRGLSFEALFA